MESNINSRLQRYTSLPVLIDILSNKRLTLLDPSTWDDKNDSHYLKVYKNSLKLKSLLALCFTSTSETYHHWKVFSGNSSAIRISFFKDELMKHFRRIKGIKSGYVEYIKIKNLKNRNPSVDELPFIKRWPFIDEKEFRIIYQNKEKTESEKHVDINLECINKIYFGPWIPYSVYNSVKSCIKEIKDCENIAFGRTTIVDNKRWRKFGDDLQESYLL